MIWAKCATPDHLVVVLLPYLAPLSFVRATHLSPLQLEPRYRTSRLPQKTARRPGGSLRSNTCSKQRAALFASLFLCSLLGEVMDASPRTAIATIWDGDHRLACGIPLWCQGARLLSQQIPRSQIVLLSQQPSEDCTEATVVWSEETAAAAAAYVASHVLRRSEVQTALLKFAMFSLSFDLVLQVRDGAALSTVPPMASPCARRCTVQHCSHGTCTTPPGRHRRRPHAGVPPLPHRRVEPAHRRLHGLRLPLRRRARPQLACQRRRVACQAAPLAIPRGANPNALTLTLSRRP